MSTEISPLQTVQDNIKSKIKAEFVNLIPDDMWTQMVASVVETFTTDAHPLDYNGRADTSKPKRPSPLKELIRSELQALASAKLKAEIDTLGRSTWNSYGEQVASAAIGKLIDENYPTLLASVQKGMVDMAVTQAVNHMRNSMTVR